MGRFNYVASIEPDEDDFDEGHDELNQDEYEGLGNYEGDDLDDVDHDGLDDLGM